MKIKMMLVLMLVGSVINISNQRKQIYKYHNHSHSHGRHHRMDSQGYEKGK